MLNEAMKFIYEKNDIINLFRILYFYDINKDVKDKYHYYITSLINRKLNK